MPTSTSSDEHDRRLLVAARTLALDAATREVAGALREAGIRCILLKGPAMARWLYDDELLRDYVDIDLLVSPADADPAANVLEKTQFELSLVEVALPHGRRPHARTFVRPDDRISIDLHDTLPGVGVQPEVAWAALSEGTETMVVGRTEIEVLGEPARALLVVLHVAHHGVKDAQALDDLARALTRTPDETWREAADVAERLEATPTLAAGLRLLPAGSRLATILELPTASSVETLLRATSAPELALSLDWLVRAPGYRIRARLILRKLAPSPGVMKARSSLARHGPLGLAAAYATQPFWLMWHGIPALRAWLAVQRQTRHVE